MKNSQIKLTASVADDCLKTLAPIKGMDRFKPVLLPKCVDCFKMVHLAYIALAC